jgi:hypothetical protein
LLVQKQEARSRRKLMGVGAWTRSEKRRRSKGRIEFEAGSRSSSARRRS